MLGRNDDICGEDLFSVMGGESQVTRHSSGHLVVRQPKYNLNICCNFFTIRTCEEWNCPPKHVKMAKLLTSFKVLYDTHVLMSEQSFMYSI